MSQPAVKSAISQHNQLYLTQQQRSKITFGNSQKSDLTVVKICHYYNVSQSAADFGDNSESEPEDSLGSREVL